MTTIRMKRNQVLVLEDRAGIGRIKAVTSRKFKDDVGRVAIYSEYASSVQRFDVDRRTYALIGAGDVRAVFQPTAVGEEGLLDEAR